MNLRGLQLHFCHSEIFASQLYTRVWLLYLCIFSNIYNSRGLQLTEVNIEIQHLLNLFGLASGCSGREAHAQIARTVINTLLYVHINTHI